MVSNVLPQALCVIPRTHTRCMYKGLASSSAISHRPFAFQGLVCNSNSSFKVHRNNSSFSVRAEAEVEGVVDDAVEGVVDDAVESVVESEQVEERQPKQPRVKLGDIMGILNKKAIEANDSERPTPDLRVGDVVEIKLEVPENRRRLSVYKGIIMSKQNSGIHTTIRIRRVIAGVGVEIVFPVYSPNIKEIRVVSHRKVRRAKLYYLRDKLPRLSTFK